MNGDSIILGLETSCDETAAAVTKGEAQVLSSIVATQDELHERYAGVVPEIASRAHVERILPVVREALRAAGCTWEDIDAVAIGHRPGLIGSLLVGVSAAKALAWSLRVPVIGVDHILAHLHAARLDGGEIQYPALGLVVSGGHTSLFHLESALEARTLGRTIDDAVGEAYDKAATILELGYPGGPALDALAQGGDETKHDLPVSMLGRDSLDFSFSGLKTALLYSVRGQPTGRGAASTFSRSPSDLSAADRVDFAASFQLAAVSALMRKLQRALERSSVASVIVGGGVSANSRLRRELEDLARERSIDIRLPQMQYCLDNAAMIAGLAALKYDRGAFDSWSLAASTRSEVA